MATAAYHAPLRLSYAAPMADDADASLPPIRIRTHIPNRRNYSSRAFTARFSSAQPFVLPIETTKRKIPCSSSSSSSNSNSIEVVTACSWNQSLLCSDVPVLVVFWASWCGPCRIVSRVVEELALEYAGRIKCLMLDADDYLQVANSHGIERIPTVLLFANGEKIESITGTLPKSVYGIAIEKPLSR